MSAMISFRTCDAPALCTPQRSASAAVGILAYVAGLVRKNRPRACGMPSNFCAMTKTGARCSRTPPLYVSTHGPTAKEPRPGRETPRWDLSCAKTKSHRPSHALRHCNALTRMRRQYTPWPTSSVSVVTVAASADSVGGAR